VNLQKVAGGKKFLELLLEAVNFTRGYRMIRRTLGVCGIFILFLPSLIELIWRMSLQRQIQNPEK